MAIDNDRINTLIKHFFEDDDHGRKAIAEASVMETLCFIDYLENVLITKAKEDNNEYDMQYFAEYDVHFRMEAVEKILALDELYIVNSVATRSLYNVEKDIIVMVDNDGEEHLIDTLKDSGIDITVQKVNQSAFRGAIKNMYRLGYKNVRFSDGRCRPFIVPKETLIKNDMNPKARINPQLYSDILVFMQEAHKASKEQKGIQINVDSPISKSVRDAIYVVPGIVQSRSGNQLQIKYPFLNTNNPQNGKVLPVFTDHIDFELFMKNPVMNNYTTLPKDKRAAIELPFTEILRVFRTDHLTGTVINPATINFVVNEPMMNVIAMETELIDNPNIRTENNVAEIEKEPTKKEYSKEHQKELRKKTLSFIIDKQKEIIEKHKKNDTPADKEKLKKAEIKLQELEQQMRELNND